MAESTGGGGSASPTSTAAPTNSVLVVNLSPQATDKTLADFFSFCGRITQLHISKNFDPSDETKRAVVVFETDAEASTALLLTNAMLVDRPISIFPYTGPPLESVDAQARGSEDDPELADSTDITQRRKNSVVAGMLADGYILGQTVLDKAHEIDEKHHLFGLVKEKAILPVVHTAGAIDQQLHVKEKLQAVTRSVSTRAKGIDEKFRIQEQTRAAVSATTQAAAGLASKALENATVARGYGFLRSSFTSLVSRAKEVKADALVKVQERTAEKREEHARTSSINRLFLDDDSQDALGAHASDPDDPSGASTSPAGVGSSSSPRDADPPAIIPTSVAELT